jgi:hypothetical protein
VIERRAFLCGMTLGPLAMPLVAEAEPAGTIYESGFYGLAALRLTSPNGGVSEKACSTSAMSRDRSSQLMCASPFGHPGLYT